MDNTPPTQTNLSAPVNGSNITDRFPVFNWSRANDADADIINYTIIIDESDDCAGHGCLAATINASAYNKTGYNHSVGLAMDTHYNWTVIGFDGFNYSVPAAMFNFTVRDLSVISFVAPTLADATTFPNSSFAINASLNDSSIREVTLSWNGTNYTLYNDSVILFLNFDNRSALGENISQSIDLSRYQNNATCAGATCPAVNATGKYGKARTFDGVDDVANVGDFVLGPSAMTACAWVRMTDATPAAQKGILSKVDSPPYTDLEFNLDIETNGTARFWISTTGTEASGFAFSTSILADNSWGHVCGVYSGASNTVYLDGRAGFSVSVSGTIYNGVEPLRIGAAHNRFRDALREFHKFVPEVLRQLEEVRRVLLRDDQRVTGRDGREVQKRQEVRRFSDLP